MFGCIPGNELENILLFGSHTKKFNILCFHIIIQTITFIHNLTIMRDSGNGGVLMLLVVMEGNGSGSVVVVVVAARWQCP